MRCPRAEHTIISIEKSQRPKISSETSTARPQSRSRNRTALDAASTVPRLLRAQPPAHLIFTAVSPSEIRDEREVHIPRLNGLPLVVQGRRIVVGEVTKKKFVFDTDNGNRMYADNSFTVIGSLKGRFKPHDEITIVEDGPGKGTEYLKNHEVMLLFLHAESDNKPHDKVILRELGANHEWQLHDKQILLLFTYLTGDQESRKELKGNWGKEEVASIALEYALTHINDFTTLTTEPFSSSTVDNVSFSRVFLAKQDKLPNEVTLGQIKKLVK